MPLLSRDELEQIPTRYRLLVKILLKLPNPSLPFFVLKHFPELEGILWALVAPCLLILYFFFNVWLFPFVTLRFGFPLNYVFAVLIPAIIFVFFLRIQLERTILLWKTIHEKPREQQMYKRVEELSKLFRRQQKKKKLWFLSQKVSLRCFNDINKIVPNFTVETCPCEK